MGAGLVLAFSFNTNNVQAAQKYSRSSLHWYLSTTYLIPKNTTASVTVWNASHTKSVANLKTFANVTWKSTATATFTHGTSKALYYRVSAWNASKTKFVTGYVWRGFVKQGLAKDIYTQSRVTLNVFPTTTDYTNYINNSKSQAISKSILKLFPNSPVNLELTRLAASKYGYFSYDGDGVNPSVASSLYSTADFTNLKSFPKITKYLSESRSSSTATRASEVGKLLTAYGYSSSKLKSLKDYQVGLVVNDYSATSNKYSYAFVIAQTK